MPLHQFGAQLGQRVKQLVAARDRDAREVGAQKGCVTLSVGRAVQHGVEVVEDFLGVQRGRRVFGAVVGGGQVEGGLEGYDESYRQIL